MKRTTIKLVVVMLVVSIGVFAGPYVSAQETMDVAEAVMQLERAQWECLKKCDSEGFNTFFHTDFVGYSTATDKPMDMARSSRKLAGMSLDYYILKPVSVKLAGDHVIVEYTYEAGCIPDQICTGRMINIWQQQGKTWKLVSSVSR